MRALSGALLLNEAQNIARAGDAGRPRAVEIGDKRLEGGRVQRRVGGRQVGEAIDRLMHARLARAPQPPEFLGFESGVRRRHVVGRIPMIEFFAQRRGDHGTDDEIGPGHDVASVEQS